MTASWGVALERFGSVWLQVAKLTADGVPVWANYLTGHRTGGFQRQLAVHDLAVNSNDELVLTGQFRQDVQLGGGPMLTGGSSGQLNAFVMQLDSGGGYSWQADLGEVLGDGVNYAGFAVAALTAITESIGWSVAVDDDDNVVIATSWIGRAVSSFLYRNIAWTFFDEVVNGSTILFFDDSGTQYQRADLDGKHLLPLESAAFRVWRGKFTSPA